MKKTEIPRKRVLWKPAGDPLSLFLSIDPGMSERKLLEVKEITTGRQ